MLRRIVRHWTDLWAGRLALSEAVWTYAVFWSFLINMATTLLTLGLVATDAPAGIAVIAHLLPLPWNLLVLVGVWRSVAEPTVPRPVAVAVRAFASVWLLVLSAT